MTSQRKLYMVRICSTVRKRAKRTLDTNSRLLKNDKAKEVEVYRSILFDKSSLRTDFIYNNYHETLLWNLSIPHQHCRFAFLKIRIQTHGFAKSQNLRNFDAA